MRQGDLPWDPPVYQGGIPHVEVNDTHFYREGYGRMAASCSKAFRESVLRKLKSLRRPTEAVRHIEPEVEQTLAIVLPLGDVQ